MSSLIAMMKIYLKYTGLIATVILSQFFILAYNNNMIAVSTNSNDTYSKFENMKVTDKVGNTLCDNMRLERTTKSQEKIYLAKDKRFHQKINLKHFIHSVDLQTTYYQNRILNDSLWSDILTNFSGKIDISDQICDESCDLNSTKKTTILIVNHPLSRFLKIYKEKVSSGILPINFYKSVADHLGIKRYFNV